MREPTTIAVLATGGTISAVADARRRHGGGLSATDLVAGHGSSGTRLRPIEVHRIPGRAMTPPHMLTLAQQVGQAAAACDGIVVLHGTDTLEETAYALAVMVDVPVPVVVTGAMRLPAQPGDDGPGNLAAAIAAARDPKLADSGPVVVFGDEVHLARWVTKAHTSRPAAFTSPDGGPAGQIHEGRLLLHRTAHRDSDHLGMPEPGRLADTRVPLVTVYAGIDGETVERAADGAAGLLIAGTGGGHTPPGVADTLATLVAAGTPVVLASRCPAGPLLQDTYGEKGGEGHLKSVGVIPVGHLPALKARLRLQIALALGHTPRKAFPVAPA
ncbi:hypothetical protein AA958_00400 [Streptomyces sp. CNQ-509]|uniref:asparaginase domain-containing protein n=1 Tax=Streptomyces sp. CNQ-509 TaxID=444103 RepID=UPI00062DDF2D|nr:asparaginase domain-containing protein [Streptomyces sp. CNQ-509]AKH80879.1 hypothetical protein AA958_00400 [Streptomyces sp. CNQ-509]